MGSHHLSRRTVLAGLGAATVSRPGAAQERESEGGIGGTGIVGLLTDLETLIVAGNRLGTVPDTAITDAFGPLGKGDLSIGDGLTVEASGPADAFIARRVHVTYPLVGTVSDVSADGRRLVVNGALVRLERPSGLARVGARVAVHGLWGVNEVVASRLAPPRSAADLVSGTVTRRGFATLVGTVPVTGGNRATDGGYAEVVGQFDPARGTLIAARTVTRRFTGAVPPLVRLSVEGFLEPTRERPGLRLAGLGHSFERNLRLDPFVNRRILLNGRYTGLFAAEGATILPENFERRRALLRRMAG